VRQGIKDDIFNGSFVALNFQIAFFSFFAVFLDF